METILAWLKTGALAGVSAAGFIGVVVLCAPILAFIAGLLSSIFPLTVRKETVITKDELDSLKEMLKNGDDGEGSEEAGGESR